jgi:uncharacterized protein YjiS (DUF1127 family)
MFSFERGTEIVSVNNIGAENFYYTRKTVRPGTWLRGQLGLWFLWYRRWQQRQHLARLDAHLLRDIGVTHPEALREADKPFWRT